MKTKHLLSIIVALALAPEISAQSCTTPTLSNGTICAGNTYTISNPGPEKLAFYNTSMNFLKLATSYTTAPATTTAYNYVATENVGAPSNTIGAGGTYTTTGKTITFNTTTTVLINTIDVYPQNAGSITIAVKDATNSVVAQTTVTVPSGGLQTIPLGFSIPSGTGYKMELIAESCGGLYRNGAGSAFPYNSPSGIISLTTTDYAFLGYYYYFYNWSVSNAACVKTLTLTISSPTAAITASGNNLSTGSFSSYQWLLNGSPISGATSQSYTATQSGVYEVNVTNSFSCSATSNAYTVTVVTGITEDKLQLAHVVYPNPVSGDVLTIEGDLKKSEAFTVSIYTVNGQLVKMISAANLSSVDPGKYTMYVNDLENGIYLLHLKGGMTGEYHKLIINR